MFTCPRPARALPRVPTGVPGVDLALGGAANDLKAPVDVFPVAAELVESQPYPKCGSSLKR